MKLPKDPSKFSFGATSSTVTSLGIIFGLLSSSNPKAGVIGSLLVIAVADNIADSLGIHIYRETSATKKENTRMFTISNFITRFGITFTFVATICIFANRLCSNVMRDDRIWSIDFLKLPHWSTTPNKHNKRNSHPHWHRHPRNRHQPFPWSADIQSIRVTLR